VLSGKGLRVVETVAVALGGAVAAGSLAWAFGEVEVVVAASVAGALHGEISGARQIYEWRRPRGWAYFLLDSTWGLLGSTLGVVVHLINLVARGSRYRADLSARRNRHVYEGGFRLKRGFIVTMGNVISNAAGSGTRIEDRPGRLQLIDRHEGLHIWQNRVFGPLMQATYVVWAAGGLLYGLGFWLMHRDESLGVVVLTTVYYDNPLEYWAYRLDGHWPPPGSHPRVRWRGRVT
jgi:hypothetical protein